MRATIMMSRIRDWENVNALVTAFVREFEREGRPIHITKLLKLLFYFDFISYKYDKRPFTGDVYYKLPYGPVPSLIKDQMDLLKEENGEIAGREMKSKFSEYLTAERDERTTKGYTLKIKKETIPKERFDRRLSEWSKELAGEIAKTFKDMSVKEVVNATHEETPYKKTKEMEIIPCLLADEKGFPKAEIAIPRFY